MADAYWNKTTVSREVRANTTVERLPQTRSACERCEGTGSRKVRGRAETTELCNMCGGRGDRADESRVSVSFRALLPKDAEAGAERESMPLLIDGLNLSAHEMRELALALWWRSFGDEPIPTPADRVAAFTKRHAVEARDELVDHLLDIAETVMQVRWTANPFGGTDAHDQYTQEVVQTVTARLMGNLHITRFMSAMADTRQHYTTETTETGEAS